MSVWVLTLIVAAGVTVAVVAALVVASKQK